MNHKNCNPADAEKEIVELGKQIMLLLQKHFTDNIAVYIDTAGIGFQDNYVVYRQEEEQDMSKL